MSREMKLPPKQPPRINTKVAEILAWKNGKRVGFGTREYQTSMRWIRLGQRRLHHLRHPGRVPPGFRSATPATWARHFRQRGRRIEQPCQWQDPSSPLRSDMKEPQPLDFEKPIAELQRRLQEIRDHSDEHALDFDAEVEAMEAKIETTRREIYGNLSAWQRCRSRGTLQRPFALDYVERCFTNWNELRAATVYLATTSAMPCGIAMLGSNAAS